MREYRLAPAFFSQMRRRILILGVPLMILAAAVGLFTASQADSSPSVLFIAALLVAIVLIFSVRKSVAKQQQIWSSYRLILDETSIKRIQDGFPEITISFDEISKVIEAPELGLDILTSTPSRRIGVPKTLHDYSEFRQELAQRHPIDSVSKSRANWIQLLPIAMGLLTLAASAITFLATNRYIIATIGTLLFVGLLLSLVSIQRSMNTAKQVKWSSWFVLLPLLVIAARVFFAISGR